MFENISNEITPIVLKFQDNFADTWEIKNTLKFEELKHILTSKPHMCFFQKQKGYKESNRSQHKIIVPIENEKAIELSAVLWNDKIDNFKEVYSYCASYGKEIPFFVEPCKETHKCNCSFRIVKKNVKDGTKSTLFQKLYETIEKLNIPPIDINKEKDKQIWQKYVEALQKLVEEKEQIWKIEKVSKTYKEKTDNYIDIYIDEKYLLKQFEKEIKGCFSENELEDYKIDKEKAFIKFKTYRELSQEEHNKLKCIFDNYFYDISKDSPSHHILAKLNFKYTDKSSQNEIFSQLKKHLLTAYQMEVNIDNKGYLDILARDFHHVQKVIKDNFASLLELKRDNSIYLKVQVERKTITPQIIKQVKSKLQEKKLHAAKVRRIDETNLVIEVSGLIAKNEFEKENLLLDKTIASFATTKDIQLKEIEGLTISGSTYSAVNLQKNQRQQFLEKIKSVNKDETFKGLPTQYHFALSQKQDIEQLRNFKTKTDIQGKTTFDINKSILTVTANDIVEYNAHISRIKQIFSDAVLEDKAYKPTFFLQFKTDIENQRQSIIERIRSKITGQLNIDAKKQFSGAVFKYDFNTEDERDSFKQSISDACSIYQNLLDFSFDNNLGSTTYKFIKNESLESEKDKKTSSDIRSAAFIYMDENQKKELYDNIFFENREKQKNKQEMQKTIEYEQKIGILVKKENSKFTFKIDKSFDDLLNGTEDKILKPDNLIGYFIKPIFVGELANIRRMIRAMEKVTNPDDKVGHPVNKNLANFLFDPSAARESFDDRDIDNEKQRILSNLNEPLLKNQTKQLEAVAKSLLAKDMALIQGPPGTGKTTVIAEIVWQTLLKEPDARVLITSQTNLAVDNALERLRDKKLVRPIRIGKIDKFEDEGKVYSYERLQQWLEAEFNSDEEKDSSRNAICEWIENVSKKCSDDPIYQKAVSKWKNGLIGNKNSLIKKAFLEQYFNHVNVFAATCSECGSKNFSDTYQSIFQKDKETQSDPAFDLVIMDEASKATPPELVLPLTLGKKVIIIGDHKQLPPMIDEKEFGEALEAVGAKQLVEGWTRGDYKISQFEKLFKNAPKTLTASLDTQFRMHEQIMNCISQFYKDQEELENGLICGIKGKMDIEDLSEKASRWHGFSSPPFIESQTHAIWVNVETPERKVGTSYENKGEIKAIQTVLQALTHANGFKEYLDFFKKEEDKEIGIITYYMPQMQKIRKTMYPKFTKNEWRNFEQHKSENEFGMPFRINTVDRFQGMERNIIIVSTVRSDKQIDANGKEEKNNKYPFALGFARELQRINVGFSRAKRLLIVVGNERHFSNKPEYAEAIKQMHKVDIAQLRNLTQ
jgi:hypothetical protein